jgi:hypothetical protein
VSQSSGHRGVLDNRWQCRRSAVLPAAETVYHRHDGIVEKVDAHAIRRLHRLPAGSDVGLRLFHLAPPVRLVVLGAAVTPIHSALSTGSGA